MPPHASAKTTKTTKTVRSAPAKQRYLTRSQGTMKDMEDMVAALEMFTLELADPDEELAVQDRPLANFPLFKKLPLELRLMIWRATFPAGRLLSLNSKAFSLLQRPTPGGGFCLPISLHVNRESRQETKIHYRIIFPSEVQELHPSAPFDSRAPVFLRQTLCFSATRDFMYHNEASFYWASLLEDYFPDIWDKVEHLVVRLDYLDDLEDFALEFYPYRGLQKLTLIEAKGWTEILASPGDDIGGWSDEKREAAEYTKSVLLERFEEWDQHEFKRRVPSIKNIRYQAMSKDIWRRG
ncbi:hypothetical protein VTL71DRAFT_15804 [Oculimacula yallundae]|uniref:2EXR domain-containing protein n=1 Tax=Oculimacula yallundae TaxID=86028 RepID=A0ABR4CCM8_9HELO